MLEQHTLDTRMDALPIDQIFMIVQLRSNMLDKINYFNQMYFQNSNWIFEISFNGRLRFNGHHTPSMRDS